MRFQAHRHTKQMPDLLVILDEAFVLDMWIGTGPAYRSLRLCSAEARPCIACRLFQTRFVSAYRGY